MTLKLDLRHTLREIPRVRQDGARRMRTFQAYTAYERWFLAGYEVATWRAMLPEERFHDSGSRDADPATIAIVEGGAV
jgi:hypothetical protein